MDRYKIQAGSVLHKQVLFSYIIIFSLLCSSTQPNKKTSNINYDFYVPLVSLVSISNAKNERLNSFVSESYQKVKRVLRRPGCLSERITVVKMISKVNKFSNARSILSLSKRQNKNTLNAKK